MDHTELAGMLRRAVRAGALLVLVPAVVSCSDRLDARASPIEATASRVLQTTHRFTTRLVTVRTELSTLATTPEHPFAKAGAGWTPAAKLALGDRVHIRGSAEGATVLELSIREIPPTPVYNLTVARTHAYFVGLQDVLVHNINCFGRTRRKPESQPPERGTPAELLEEERERERAAKWALPRNGGKFLDIQSPDAGRCTACVMASLGNFDTLSHFLDAHADKPGIDESLRGLDDGALMNTMKSVGLRSDTTPEPETFPKPGTALELESVIRAERPGGARFQYWRAIENFMQTSRANTFAVSVQSWKDGKRAHALVGVRKDDGTIAFLDFSLEPPVLLDVKKLNIWSVLVIPTDVNWRDNRHVNDLFKNDPKLTPPPKDWLPQRARRARWLPFSAQ
jgi:hypothetical protein